MTLSKTIRWFGRACTLACDGRCDKAWGINNRPRLFYMQDGLRALARREEPADYDDYVYIGDNELGTAPADPGTYEGDHGKPSAQALADPSLMNKWCARECERSGIFEEGETVVIHDLVQPRPNIPKKADPNA